MLCCRWLGTGKLAKTVVDLPSRNCLWVHTNYTDPTPTQMKVLLYCSKQHHAAVLRISYISAHINRSVDCLVSGKAFLDTERASSKGARREPPRRYSLLLLCTRSFVRTASSCWRQIAWNYNSSVRPHPGVARACLVTKSQITTTPVA